MTNKISRFLHHRWQIFVGRFSWQTELANFIDQLTSPLYCYTNSQDFYGFLGNFQTDSLFIQNAVSGKMHSKDKRGRPHREWTDDVVEWCGANLQELSHSARDRNNWQKMVKQASDVNGHWALWWLMMMTQNAKWVSEWVRLNVPLDTLLVILETVLQTITCTDDKNWWQNQSNQHKKKQNTIINYLHTHVHKRIAN